MTQQWCSCLACSTSGEQAGLVGVHLYAYLGCAPAAVGCPPKVVQSCSTVWGGMAQDLLYNAYQEFASTPSCAQFQHQCWQQKLLQCSSSLQ